MREDVGVVGAKLLYNDHTVQHAGVLVGAGGLADHVFKGIHEDDPGYMGRAISSQDVSAVTAACLLVKRSVYEEVGGLEDEFQVAFNDVDFCLKVRKAGYLIGTGKTMEEAVEETGMVVEGIKACKAFYELKEELGIEMPITDALYQVLFKGKNAKEMVNMLLQRDKKSETY